MREWTAFTPYASSISYWQTYFDQEIVIVQVLLANIKEGFKFLVLIFSSLKEKCFTLTAGFPSFQIFLTLYPLSSFTFSIKIGLLFCF